jgi:ERCC4-type nuclease
MKKDTRCILVDTREKRPWEFKAQKKDTLKYGDYSILGSKTKIVIERKALIDLFVTFSQNRWPKFYSKMLKATEKLDYVFLFIEASLSEIRNGIPYSKLPTTYIMNRICDLMAIGVQVIFTGNSKQGPIFAERILRKLTNGKS